MEGWSLQNKPLKVVKYTENSSVRDSALLTNRGPHVSGQTFLLHKWSRANMTYAAAGSAGRLLQYPSSGVWPSSGRCGLVWL